MKKKLSITILGLFICCVKLIAGINYINYHKDIINAEDLFIRNNDKAAVEAYKRIFTQYSKAFVKDCYIAAQVACHVKDTINLKLFLTMCFNKGMEWSIIDADSNLAALLNQYPSYKKVIKNEYDNSRDIFCSSINIPLRYEITTMFKKDQLYHDIKPQKLWDSLFRMVTKENIERIITITKQYGYPGEHLIGISNNILDNTCITLTDSDLEEITPLFFYHQACGFQILSKELYESVIKGDIHPREYATLYEWSHGNIKSVNDTAATIVYIVDSIGTMTPVNVKQVDNSEDLKICKHSYSQYEYRICNVMNVAKYFAHQTDAQVNKNRFLIGISSVEHDERKREYAQKHNMTLFFGTYSKR
jgi:hypothetical protein